MRTTIVLCFSLAILASCSSSQKDVAFNAPSVPVVVATPSVQSVPVYVESLGTLHPSIFMEVRPRVGGTLTEILVKEGEWVEKGTPLFTIGSGSYSDKLLEIEAQAAINRASLNGLKKKIERWRALADKDLISEIEWDDLENQVAKAQAIVDTDTSKIKGAQGDITKCTVVAPLKGRVGKLDASPGIPVSPTQPQPLATISKMDPLLLEFAITEKEFAQLAPDQKQIQVQSLYGECAATPALITFFDNQFDDRSGLLLVRGKVDNPSMQMRPGQHVRVRLPVANIANAKLIPQKAVKYNQQGPYVFVAQTDNTAVSRQLTLGHTIEDKVIVLEGLDASERIVTEGHLRLYPGALVEVQQ